MAGRGTIDQMEPGARSKCRKWRIRVSTGMDPMTGKYGRITRTVTGSYRDAQRALNELLVADEPQAKSKETFGELVQLWLGTQRVRENTMMTYRSAMRQLTSSIGTVRMDRLTRDTLQTALDNLLKGNSPSYVHLVRSLLMSFLHWAEKNDVIASAARLEPEPIRVPRTARNALTDDSVALVMGSCVAEEPLHRAVMLAMLAGLRKGECLALSWEDIDFEHSLMHVHGTKTEGSDATVPVTRELLEFLWPVRGTGLVVGLHRATLDKKWVRFRGELGLEGATFHELRHTYITMLARADVHPAVMQKLARHATSRMTMEVYTHVHMEDQRGAIEALQGRLDMTKSRPKLS